jgi:hypothetical protein
MADRKPPTALPPEQLAEPTVAGAVVNIVGQRVTLREDGGKEVTLTIPSRITIKPGDRLRVGYTVVGDTLRASTVTRLP